jgi:hypothetical protein
MDATLRRPRGVIPSLRRLGVVAALAVAVGACSATGASLSPTSSTTTPTSAPSSAASPAASGAAGPSSGACQDLNAAKAAITSLATLDVKSVGADGVKAAITTLRTSLETLKASASADLAPAVAAVTTALDTLQTTVDGANGDLALAAAPIGQAVLGVAAAMSALDAAAKTDCG